MNTIGAGKLNGGVCAVGTHRGTVHNSLQSRKRTRAISSFKTVSSHLIPALRKQSPADLWEFKARLAYVASCEPGEHRETLTKPEAKQKY